MTRIAIQEQLDGKAAVSRNTNGVQKQTGSFDSILDAVSADHDINCEDRFSIDMASLNSESIA